MKKKGDQGAWGRNQHRERVKKKPAQRAREEGTRRAPSVGQPVVVNHVGVAVGGGGGWYLELGAEGVGEHGEENGERQVACTASTHGLISSLSTRFDQ